MPNKHIDWYYHRVGCTTCRRADEFLERVGAKVTEKVNARKVRIGPQEAIDLVRTAHHLYVARGKKVVHVDFEREQPSDAELTKLIIGPSGNLRAPALRAGKRLFIGFNADEIAGGLWAK